MRKLKIGISQKMMIGMLILGTLIGVSIGTVSYIRFKAVIERMYNDTSYHIAETAMTYLDGDQVEQYLQTKETDENYRQIESRLTQLRKTMHVNYIYVAKVEGIQMTYVFDAENSDDTYPTFVLGERGKIDPTFEQDAKQIIATGERSDNYFYAHSEFGYNTTAILPVKNSQGKVVALLGVEIAIANIQKILFGYLKYVIFLIVIILSLLIGLYLKYLKQNLIRPVQLVTGEAEKFVHGKQQISQELRNVHTGDEIEELSQTVYQMQVDIKDYIENLMMVTAEKERIGTELSVATHIQESMLPCIFPAYPQRRDFEIYASMDPANEVGGDFYDFFLIDEDHLALVIADVSGKGVPAALFMVITKTLLKNQAQSGIDLATVFSRVNEQLCENNEAGMFVTVWMGIVELSSGMVKYVNAGHNPPIIGRQRGKVEYLKNRSGFVLAGMPGTVYHQQTMQLETEDLLFLYTDGITEAADETEQLYGGNRLMQILEKNKAYSAADVILYTKADIQKFVGSAHQSDDITMLAFRRKEMIGEKYE